MNIKKNIQYIMQTRSYKKSKLITTDMTERQQQKGNRIPDPTPVHGSTERECASPSRMDHGQRISVVVTTDTLFLSLNNNNNNNNNKLISRKL